MTADTPESFAEKFVADGKKTVDFLQKIPEERWDRQIYEDGAEWTVRQIGMHLVEAEKSLPGLISNVLAGGEGVPKDFDLDRYNESKVRKMGNLTRDEIISQFSELRSETVKMVGNLKEKDLEVTGRHPFAGETTIREMLRLMMINVNVHIRDIRRVLDEN